MAGKNIKGITIEIGGDTTELGKALKQPEAEAKKLSSELREIDKALKFNPDSMELLAQKSTVLAGQVAAATDKLLTLRQASKQVQEQAASGEIGEEQYRAFQREIIQTESKLQGFQSELSATDGRIKVLNGDVKNAADSAEVFEDAFAAAEKELEETKKKIDALTIAMGNLISKGIQAAANSIRNFSGAAIERYDTLSKFPEMLKMMGFEASAAEAATQNLSAGIAGLPTTLNDIISTAQNLTILTGNLEQSVDIALALNNAFLAGGASASDAARGMEQYTQMLAKGSVDMQSWRTLQETMGYALRETAEAMGFAGESATNDLYKALQSGKKTFSDFTEQLIELSNATGGFADTAKTASSGIATSFSNMKTAVVRGITAIIQALDRNKNIQNFLESTGKGFESLLKTVAIVANVFTTLLYPALWLVSNGMGAVLTAVGMLTTAFIVYKATLTIVSILEGLAAGFTLLESAMLASKTIMNLITIAQTQLNVAMAANPVGLVVAAVAALVVGLIALWRWLTGTKKAQDDTTASTNSLTAAFTKNVNAAGEVVGAGDEITESYNNAAESTKKLSTQIYDTFKDAVKAAKDYNKQFQSTGFQLVTDARGYAKVVSRTNLWMYENLKSYIDEHYKGASDAEKSAIAKTIYNNKEMLDQIKRDYYGVGPAIGASIADGMTQGINDRRGQVINSVRSLTNDVKKEFESGLQIHSPSRVTEKYGKFTIDGFVNAINDGRRSVQRAMVSMMDSVKGELTAAASAIDPARQSAAIASSSTSSGTTIGSQTAIYQITVAGLTELQEFLDFQDNMRRRGRALNGEG